MPVEAPKFTHDQLLEALYHAWDAFERANLRMVVVGSTADSIVNNKDLYGDHIMIGIRINEWKSGSKTIVDAFFPPLKDEGTVVRYEFAGIPIDLFVLEDTPSLISPNTVIYHSEYFNYPNPYNQFLEDYKWLLRL